jgi:hypothetical protein
MMAGAAMLSRWRLQEQIDESGWGGVEEDALMTAAGTRRGGGRLEASLSLRRTTTMGGIFPRRWRDGDGCGDD